MGISVNLTALVAAESSCAAPPRQVSAGQLLLIAQVSLFACHSADAIRMNEVEQDRKPPSGLWIPAGLGANPIIRLSRCPRTPLDASRRATLHRVPVARTPNTGSWTQIFGRKVPRCGSLSVEPGVSASKK